jgi:hypothetical protein
MVAELIPDPDFQYRLDVLNAMILLKKEGVLAISQLDEVLSSLGKTRPGLAGVLPISISC